MSFPRSHARPAKDEWGVYDPQQAGLAALFAKLDTKDAKAPVTAAARFEAKVSAQPAAAKPAVAPAAPLPARPSLRDAK
jgi:hypothetical protein